MNGPSDKSPGLLSRITAQLTAWIAPRWDGPQRLGAFLAKPLPRNVSWLHTLGGLLLLYIGFQTLTGILLGFYYSPGPESAYESVRYVQEELFLGRFLHHLHRYGSGFIIVTAFLHLARSYFLAAYKAPRELLWITGVMLFILLTLLAFTGQLLPFDQRGYWATVVGIDIASSAPGIGKYVGQILTGGYGDIGAVTLSRFYILHVSLLPFALFGLIALHLGILQRTGSAGPAEGSPEPIRPFFPSQALKDILVAGAGALALCLVAAFVTTAETGPADPASSDFVPRPEWYFLSHYQILKSLPGSLKIIGTFVLPNLLFGALFMLPFIDRSSRRAIRQRPVVVTAGLMVGIAIIGLTVWGVLTPPPAASQADAVATSVDPVEHGRLLFSEMECTQCHTIAGQGGTQGPNLSHVAGRIRPDYFPLWIRNPRRFKSDTEMPSFEGTDDELAAIVEYLLTLQ